MTTDVRLNLNAWWTGPHPLLGRATYVWTQGCPRRCPGCCNVDALPIDQAGTSMTPEALATLCEIEPHGVVLSGGEPFLQAAGLARTCTLLRERVRDIPIVGYTGYLIEELLDVPGGAELLRQIDVLIDGPFDASCRSSSPLVGSTNQRILLLTDRLTRGQITVVSRATIVAGVEPGGIRMVGAGATVPHMHRLARAIASAPLGACEQR